MRLRRRPPLLLLTTALWCGGCAMLVSEHVWRLVWGSVLVPGGARGFAWLQCVVARWGLPRLAASSLGVFWAVAGGERWAGVWCVQSPGMVPVGCGCVARLAWCSGAPALVDCVSHVLGVGELVRRRVTCGTFRLCCP